MTNITWREISTAWTGKGTAFEASDSNGSQIQVGKREDGSGVSPMDAALIALAGCTGDDVLSILKKKRLEVLDFSIDARGKRAEEHPRVYTEIEVRYHLRGRGLTEKDVEQAIRLSEEKYCSVSAMLKGTAVISVSFEIENV